MKTAQSQRACEMMIAPSLSGKNLYASPQTSPATRCSLSVHLLDEVVVVTPHVACYMEENHVHQCPQTEEPVDFRPFPEEVGECHDDRHCRSGERPGSDSDYPLSESMFAHNVIFRLSKRANVINIDKNFEN